MYKTRKTNLKEKHLNLVNKSRVKVNESGAIKDETIA